MLEKTKAQIIKKVDQGHVVILPTDTVYGLCTAVNHPVAVANMYAIKQREGKPGTVIAASIEQLAALGFDTRELSQAEPFWPGPVSVILTSPPSLSYLDMGKGSLAVRIPDVGWLQALLRKTGPLATTSANKPGQPTVTAIAQAEELFGDQVSVYVDGGDLSGRAPSQIIRLLEDGQVERLR